MTAGTHHLLRTLRQVGTVDREGTEIKIDNKTYIQFCTNNYLGLAQDSEVIAAAREALACWGAGAGSARLVAGSLAIHHEVETELARLKNTEAALLFPTGYMANLAVLTTLAGPHDTIVSDKLNHASLLDAAAFSGARHRTFPHRQYSRGLELLRRAVPANQAPTGDLPANDAPLAPAAVHESRRFLVSDAVFSMDGDVADLPALCAAAQRVSAITLIDDAHGTGVLGSRGAGLAELQGVESRIDVTIGTLSKALGSLGGFVAGPRVVMDTLINAARSFIFTTALPPASAAAALAALRITQRDPTRRQRVLALADHVRGELRAMGYNCGDSVTPIIPVILGDADKTLAASAALRECGLYIPAIRPPTVPLGASRLRVSLMATHTDGHVSQLLEAFKGLAPTLLAKAP